MAGDCQGVNLFSLTFGRREEEEEEEDEEEKSHPDILEAELESPSILLTLPSQTLHTNEVAMETISFLAVKQEDEEEEEDDDEDELSPYMRR